MVQHIQFQATDYTVPAFGQRNVGDTTSVPDPTFIGRKINDIFFIETD